MILVAFQLFHLSAQVLVIADTNYTIASDFKLSAAQITGSNTAAGIFGTNAVNLQQFRSGTNTVATNAALMNAAATNASWQFAATLFGQNFWTPNYALQNTNTLSQSSNSLALGGRLNLINTASPLIDSAVILAGVSNVLYGASVGNGIVGGQANRINYFPNAFIVGGMRNAMEGGSGPSNSIVLGGERNTISAQNAVVLGGASNVVSAANAAVIAGISNNVSGAASVAMGTSNLVSGANSFAGGANASSSYNRTFVFSGTNALAATANGQFLISGNVGVNTNNPGTNALAVFGSVAVNGGDISVNGTNFLATLTALSQSVNYWLSFGSNALQVQINDQTNNLLSASNALQTQITAVSAFSVAVSNLAVLASNATVTVSNWTVAGLTEGSNNVLAASNALASQISTTIVRAGTLTINSSDTAATYSFSYPMPDGSYQVIFSHYDATAQATELPYADDLQAGHFVAHLSYSTNYSRTFRWVAQHDSP